MTKTKQPAATVETSTSTATPHTESLERFPLEQLIAETEHPAYLIAAARVHKRWLPGQELTREQFNRAIGNAHRSVIE